MHVSKATVTESVSNVNGNAVDRIVRNVDVSRGAAIVNQSQVCTISYVFRHVGNSDGSGVNTSDGWAVSLSCIYRKKLLQHLQENFLVSFNYLSTMRLLWRLHHRYVPTCYRKRLRVYGGRWSVRRR